MDKVDGKNGENDEIRREFHASCHLKTYKNMISVANETRCREIWKWKGNTAHHYIVISYHHITSLRTLRFITAHRIITSYQYILSTLPINTLSYQHTTSSLRINTPYRHSPQGRWAFVAVTCRASTTTTTMRYLKVRLSDCLLLYYNVLPYTVLILTLS